MNRIITMLRASVFTNKAIPFTPEGAKEVCSLFQNEDLLVIINNNPFMLQNSPILDWSLQSIDKSLVINFSFNKIDIIKNAQIDKNINEELFLSFINDKFCNLMKKCNFEILRIAFAPSYVISLDTFSEFANKVFKKTQFQESKFSECSFSTTFVRNEIINKDSVSVNFCCNVSSIKDINNFDNSDIKKVFANIDINTSQNEKRNYNEEFVKEFFTKAKKYNSDFFNYYFN